MGFTLGTDSTHNLPVYLRFIYNGNTMGWGQPYRVNDFSNSSEAVDGNYRISDMDVYFVDINGSYFATQFGRGTLGFGTDFQVIAYVGGTMEANSAGAATTIQRFGSVGAGFATIHTGKIYSISFADRLLRIRSKSNLALLSNLKWQFPVEDSGPDTGGAYWQNFGSTLFYRNVNLAQTYYGTTAFYDIKDNYTSWRCNAYFMATNYGPSGYLSVNGFPPLTGRGTVPIDSNYIWAGTDSGGTNFYDVYQPFSMEGSYLGTYIGTITSIDSAREFGFNDLDDANGSVYVATQTGTDGTHVTATYYLMKNRFKTRGTFSNRYMHMIGRMTLSGSPTDIFQLHMTGAMVSPYFASSDLDSTSLSSSATTCAYSYYSRELQYGQTDSVLESLKSIFQTTQALFSVNSSNKFEFRAYGPKNLSSASPTAFGTANIIHSEFSNLEDDYYNRYIVHYRWNELDGTYQSVSETKSDNWGRSYDRPLTLESKWIYSDNEAGILSLRLKAKYANTFPHIAMKTNLNQIGLDLGTLIRLTDPNSGMISKTMQITGFSKSWQDKTCTFDCWDGEALFTQRGHAFWGPNVALPGVAVSGTSTAGWGTLGTQNNIDGATYGSCFVWW